VNAGAMGRLAACRRGVSAVEMALVLPLFFAMLLGIFNLSLLLWTQASLYYAAQAAARCASVNTTTCGNEGATRTYAESKYFGQMVGGAPPTITAPPPIPNGCGYRVTASYDYPLSIPFYETPPRVPLSASACFPAPAS
jgi:hypothetical protein